MIFNSNPFEENGTSDTASLREAASENLKQAERCKEAGDFEKALEYGLKAAENAEQYSARTDDDEDSNDILFNIYMLISYIYGKLGDETEDHEYTEKAVDIFAQECISDIDVDGLRKCIEFYDEHGRLLYEAGNYPEASLCCRKGIRVKECIVSADDSVSNLTGLAMSYALLVKLNMTCENNIQTRDALLKENEVRDRIAAVDDDTDNRRSQAENCRLLGYFSEILDEPEDRLMHYQKGLSIGSALAHDTGFADDYCICGDCSAELGRYYETCKDCGNALEYYLNAIKAFETAVRQDKNQELLGKLDRCRKRCDILRAQADSAEAPADMPDISEIPDGFVKGLLPGTESIAVAVSPVVSNTGSLTLSLKKAAAKGLITFTEAYGRKYVTFGQYGIKQYKHGTGCVSTDKKAPLLWEVLESRSNDRYVLLLCRGIVGFFPYRRKPGLFFGGWKDSDVLKELNTDFISLAFSDSERQAITTADLTDPDNEISAVKKHDSAKQKVFVLSYKEADTYFPGGRKTALSRRIRRDGSGKLVDWWLRTPGKNRKFAATVKSDGTVSIMGIDVRLSAGICPALWLNLEM